MRLNPLHHVQVIADYMRSTGEYWDAERCTGRTTALIFEYIAKAIRTPHTWIETPDHHNTMCAQRDITRRICETVHKLGLEHFTANANGYICFGTPPLHLPMSRGARCAR